MLTLTVIDLLHKMPSMFYGRVALMDHISSLTLYTLISIKGSLGIISFAHIDHTQTVTYQQKMSIVF